MADRNTTIRASQLRNFSVTAEDLENNSITGNKFIDLTISGSKISNSTVTDGKLASSYVYADGTRSLTGTWSYGSFDISGSGDIFTTGNMGVGTATANARLEVEDGGTTKSVVLKVTADDDSLWALQVGNDTANTVDNRGLGFYISNANFGVIGHNGVDSIVINTSGNVKLRGSSNFVNEFSTDGTLVDNSDLAIPTEQAVKTYVDAQVSPDTIEIDPTPPSSGTARGMTATMTVDVNATGFGAALYMASDGNFEEANATSSGTVPCTALSAESGTGSKMVLLVGFARNDAWNWTAGEMIYVGTSNGSLTQIQPSSSGEFVQLVGYATHADRIYFNPNLAMNELA